MTAYHELAAELLRTGVLSDPWLDGEPRFRTEPVVLTRAQARELTCAAEAVCALHNEVARLCAADPSLLGWLGLTPVQRLLWESSAPAWHGLARADVFWTAGGPKVCELNSDTPSGEAEAVLLNQAAHARRPELHDPNAGFAEKLVHLVEAMALRPGRLTIGILYPTELVEDLSMIRVYQRWLEARGHRVVLGSPFNLKRLDGRAALFDAPCDVFVRHYKTDWWGERVPVWRSSEPYADAEPLAQALGVLYDGIASGSCVVVNPFGAVVTQNKRAMALMWQRIESFPAWAQAAIRRYVPYTVRLDAAPQIWLHDRKSWVLKSDYGCEGAEVVMGCDVSDAEWREYIRQAAPGRFVLQRRFEPRVDLAGETTNFGVYCIGGKAAGFFTRVHRGATDYHARTAATLIEAGT